MEDLFENWDNLIGTLLNEFRQNVRKPLFWYMGLLIIIVFFVLYDLPKDKKNARRSITGLFRYALRVVLSFVEDLLAAVESITGFVDVLRVILKGKLTDGVQFLLGNYAIIALSVASFFTTYNGLKEIIGNYTAALITFGIQVGILAMSSRLALDLNKNNQARVKAFKEIDYFEKNFEDDVTVGKKAPTAFNSISVHSWLVGPQSNQKEMPKKGQKGKIVVHSLLLAFSMIVSIYFSYVYFYKEHVAPKQALDNNILVRNTISEITDEFSSKISEMHNILLGRLQDVNQQTRGIADPALITQVDDRIAGLEEQLSQRQQERDSLRNRINELREELTNANAEGDAAQVERTRNEISQIQEDIWECDEKIDDLDVEIRNSTSDRNDNVEYYARKEVLAALDELEKFYADPISYIEIMSVEKTNQADGMNQAGNNWRSIVTTCFEQVINYNQENSQNTNNGTTEIYEDWLTIFNNYANLCEYYERHGEEGFYNILESTEWMFPERTGEDDQKDDETIIRQNNEWNQESAKLVGQMMDELGSLPDMVQWNSINPLEQNAIRGLSKTKDMKDLYRLYRVSTGNVDILEMVFLKWRMDFNGLLLVIAFLAAFVDVLAVILTLVKGTMHYENKLPRYRKLLHKIFIQDARSDNEKWKIRIVQWAGGLGVAIGLLAFGFYYGLSGNEKGVDHQLVSLVCFVALGALISRIIVSLYIKAHDDAKDWKEEDVYKQLRSIWKTRRIETINDLRGKMRQAHDNGSDVYLGKEEVKWIVQLLSSAESGDILEVLRPEARLLLRHIDMMRIKKRTWEYYFANQGLSSAKNYIQGWFDEIDVAYIDYVKVKKCGMAFPFAVLRAEGLIVYYEGVVAKSFQTPGADVTEIEANACYILSGRFLRILYELIMEANRGTEIEDDFYITDDLADAYEAEEMTED